MTSRYRLLVTVLLVLFMLTSVTRPGALVLAPVVIEGVKVMLASAVVIAIGTELGKHWDEINVYAALDSVRGVRYIFHGNEVKQI